MKDHYCSNLNTSTNRHVTDEEIKEVKTALKSCIMTHKGGLPTNSLRDEYKQMTDQEIPYLKLGYNSLFHLLRDIPEIQSKRNEKGEPVLMVKASTKTQHLQEMIRNQKDPKISMRSSKKNIIKNYSYNNIRQVQRQHMHDAYRDMSLEKEKNPPENENWGRPLIHNDEDFENSTPIIINPVVGTTQLIGDDYFLQLCIKYLQHPLERKNAKSAITCGTVQSGLTIDKAARRLDKIKVMSNKLVINVGTVDIYNRRTSEEMIEDYKYLLEKLERKYNYSPKQITLCTLPPMGNVGVYCEMKKYTHFCTFNNWLRDFANKRGYGLLDLYEEFTHKETQFIDYYFFQQDARNVSGTIHAHVLWNYYGRQKAMKLLLNL